MVGSGHLLSFCIVFYFGGNPVQVLLSFQFINYFLCINIINRNCGVISQYNVLKIMSVNHLGVQ